MLQSVAEAASASQLLAQQPVASGLRPASADLARCVGQTLQIISRQFEPVDTRERIGRGPVEAADRERVSAIQSRLKPGLPATSIVVSAWHVSPAGREVEDLARWHTQR